MKSNLLTGLALVGALALPCRAHAEKSYVQLTSGNQLAEGAKYAVAGVFNANNISWERFYTLNDDNTGTHLPLAEGETIGANQVWSLQALPSRGEHLTFAMVQDGHYLLNIGDDQTSLNTATAVENNAYVEFRPITNATFPEEQLFTVRYNLTNGTSDNSRGIGYQTTTTNARWGKFSGSTRDTYMGTIAAQSTQWTVIHRVYLEIDTENPEEAAHAYWNQVLAEKATWAASISDELVAQIKAMPLPTDVEWNAGTLQAQAETAFFPALLNTVANERDTYVTAIQALRNHTAFTDAEIDAAVAALNAISFEGLNATPDVLAAKQAEIAKAVNDFWTVYNELPILVKFYRATNSNPATYVAINGNNATGSVKFTPEAFWHLEHTTGMNFRLKNCVTEAYLTQGASDEWTFVTGTAGSYTEVGKNNWIALQNTTQSGDNVLHKNNTSVDGFIWYNANDQGSALQVLRPGDDFITFMGLTPELNTSTWLLGKGNQSKLDKLTAAINDLSDSDFAADALAATLEKIAPLYNEFAAPASNIFVTIDASANCGLAADVNNRAFYYSTSTATSGQNTFTNFSGEGKTEANSIWYFNDNNLVCYENGLYAKVNNKRFIVFPTTVADNENPTHVKFVNGQNEAGAYQMIYDGGRGFHVAAATIDGLTGWQGNACGDSNTDTHSHTAHNLSVTLVNQLPVTIHADGFGSIVSPLPIQAPANAEETYITEIQNDALKFVKVESTTCVIAPNTHVLIKAAANTTVYVPLAYDTDEYTYPLGNAVHEQLLGSHVARRIDAEDGMNYYAKYPRPEAAEIMLMAAAAPAADFVKLEVEEDGKVTVPAGAMVVALPVENADSDVLSIDPEGTPVPLAINEISIDGTTASSAIYDLQGRRLAAPTKGINIINGKKVLVK